MLAVEQRPLVVASCERAGWLYCQTVLGSRLGFTSCQLWGLEEIINSQTLSFICHEMGKTTCSQALPKGCGCVELVAAKSP